MSRGYNDPVTREEQLRELLARTTLKFGENHPLAVKIRQRLAEQQIGQPLDGREAVRTLIAGAPIKTLDTDWTFPRGLI